jgi:hypothetical protein
MLFTPSGYTEIEVEGPHRCRAEHFNKREISTLFAPVGFKQGTIQQSARRLQERLPPVIMLA